MDRPRLGVGILVSTMSTAALTGILALADQLAGLPFAPFDVFDWLARTLPGGVIRLGIDVMVAVLNALGLSVRDTSKTAEHIMAIAGLFIACTAMGTALFAVSRKLALKRNILLGLMAGLAMGMPVTIISLSAVQMASRGPFVSAVWLIAVFAGWGTSLGWAYDRLTGTAKPLIAPTVRAQGGLEAASGQELTVEQRGRREFLIRMGATSAAITVVGSGLASALATRTRQSEEAASAQAGTPASADAQEALVDLPNASDALIPALGTRPEYTPLDQHYRIDINLRPVTIDGEAWRLNVGGLVERPLSLSLGDLHDRYPPINRFVTLSCISNSIGGDLISTTLWTGVSLKAVLADAGLKPEARYLLIRSRDGFHESVPLDLIEDDERIMLTYAWDGKPLKEEHGYPLRIYIPDRYGMKQPKWITDLQVSDTDEPGYWVVRRWDEVARVQATSVIDTVAVESAYEANGQMRVPIGGIAYAGARGISKVEVQVDGEEWAEAMLRKPLSDTTWVIWRYDWPLITGDHTFTVRCTEADGTPQIERRADVFPSGATGYHSRRARA